jgi:hypothetical protein
MSFVIKTHPNLIKPGYSKKGAKKAEDQKKQNCLLNLDDDQKNENSENFKKNENKKPKNGVNVIRHTKTAQADFL